jgi:mono/diheme cytochrome c family protein
MIITRPRVAEGWAKRQSVVSLAACWRYHAADRSRNPGEIGAMKIRTLLALIGFLAVLGLIGAAVYFVGGYYSVAATREEPRIVKWMLGQFRTASVARHATDQPPMSLDDPAVVREGARAYAVRGCPACHGAPGVNWEKFSEGMRPYPPNLKEVAKEREPQQLFWAIRNGINMTGMPGFALIEVPDREIWTIAAFVKKLPGVSDQDYKTWSAPPVVTPLR